MIAGGLLSVHAGLDNNWDMRNYHLYNAFAWLDDRYGRDLNAAGLQTTFNPLIDVPSYLLSVRWLPHMPRLVAFLAGLPYGAFAWLVLSEARLLPGGSERWQAELAMAIGLSGTTIVSEIGQSYGDILTGIFILGALWPPLGALVPGHARRGRWLGACAASGMLLGIAGGLKLTACIFAPGLALGLFVAGGSWQRRFGGAVAFCGCWLLGAGIAGGWWAEYLWTHFGNPIFPNMNDVFHSPWAAPSSGRDTRFLPRSLVQAVFYPFWWLGGHPFVVSETGVRDWHFAFAYVAIVVIAGLALLRWLRERAAPDRPTVFVCLFFVVGFVIWEAEFSILRYAVPLEALTGAVIVAALRSSLPPRRVLQGGVAVLVFLVAGSGWPGWGRVRNYGASVFEIDAPTLPDHSVVVVASKPNGFVLPFLRGRDLSFVGVVDLSAGTRLHAMVAERLGHADQVFALMLRGDAAAVSAVAAMGRTIELPACQPVRTPRASDIALCPTRPS